jgi:hypothetical protein
MSKDETENQIIEMTEPQLRELAAGRCPGCGGPLQASEFFPDTVLCRARTLPGLCKMYFRSPATVAEGLEFGGLPPSYRRAAAP